MENTLQGKIIKGVGGFYTVLTESGRFTCKARGLFRKQGQVPLPGDNVVIAVGKKGEGFIQTILPRKNELLRPALANVDTLLIVVAATEPGPDLELVDKLLLYCAQQGVRPVIAVNKCDEGPTEQALSVAAQYNGSGAELIFVSAETGYGRESLFSALASSTAAFAGQSAVGKSSLINALLGLGLKTGELSLKTERGRHTTRHAELIPTPEGGLIADTPGFSLLEAVPLEPEELPRLYPEFELETPCRFNGCMHINEPDCAVKKAVEGGLIDKHRYERYKKIASEAIEARRHKYD